MTAGRTERLAAALRLQAWLSPAFPTGGFAYSHGIEWAVEAGDIRDEATLREWVTDVLRFGTGRSDAILLRLAHRSSFPPPPGLRPQGEEERIAEVARALVASRERLLENVGQGNAFVAAASSWRSQAPPDLGDLPYPVAVGLLAGAHGIDADTTVACVLQAFAASLISAAVRLVPLGQSTGLAVLASLEGTITSITIETRGAELHDLGGACFRSDIAAMRHETQYTRLFRS